MTFYEAHGVVNDTAPHMETIIYVEMSCKTLAKIVQ